MAVAPRLIQTSTQAMQLADIAVSCQGRDIVAANLRAADIQCRRAHCSSLISVLCLKQVQRGQLRLGASLEPLTTASRGRARSLFVESGREDNADKVP
jgi:hypothetical protein